MRKIVLSLALVTWVVAENLPMPPMPPMMNIPPVEKKSETKADKKVKQTPQECNLLPPMVVFLPPPMEKMLDECKNKLYIPKAPDGATVEAVEGFSMLYKVTSKAGVKFCNKTLDKCIKGELIDAK
jgi:hypothetical protein